MLQEEEVFMAGFGFRDSSGGCICQTSHRLCTLQAIYYTPNKKLLQLD
jgi:hypothetical protein